MSLSKEDFLDFGTSFEPNIIDYQDTSDDEHDSYVEFGLNTSFCFKSVDYDEVLDYVDEINAEPQSLNDHQNDNNDIRIEKLTNEVEELKKAAVLSQRQMTTRIDLLTQQNEEAKYEILTMKSKIQLLESELKKAKMPTGIMAEEVSINDENVQMTVMMKDESSTNGIMAHMGDKVQLYAGGEHNPKLPISNLIVDNDQGFYNYFKKFVPSSMDHSFILFDFGQKVKIDLHSYLIRSNDSGANFCHPKSWRIEGSNDKVCWFTLDIRVDDESLRGKYYQNHFLCQKGKFGEKKNRFRNIRFVQTASWKDDCPFNVFITYFELYGAIYESK